MPKTVSRVLVYRLGSMGDTVVALPALHLVARAFPAAERRLLTNFPINSKAAAAAGVLDGSGLVTGYFAYPVGTRSFGVLLRLWWALLCWRPEVVVYLAASRGVAAARRDRWFFRTLGWPRLAGFPVTEELQRNLPLGNGELEPECMRLCRTLAGLGDARAGERAAWDLRLSAAEHARAEEVLRPAGDRPLVLFSLGTKLQANDWGQENWRAAMQSLGTLFPGYALAFTGVAAESAASEYVAEGWRQGAGAQSPVVGLCGILSPRESAACFARARVFVGHDSGPMHLASAVGTPVVAVFSSRNLPRVWFPMGPLAAGRSKVIYHPVNCMGCGLETCVIERRKCIRGIEVREVVEAVASVLRGTAADVA